jgi:endoglucanase
MSLFWSQWGDDLYNEECINWLYKDWKCTIVRAAMGVESGGYLTNPETELEKICTVIDACINNGIYVIVDWHDHNAQDHLEKAQSFFKIISEKYGDNQTSFMKFITNLSRFRGVIL